jgi:putative transposase
MPRKARITLPGAVHHVMSRGIEGNAIFRNDEDRHYFLHLLEKNVAKSGYLLYAWCLMDNHYHLLLRMNEYPLGRFMGLLNGPYAQYFRKNNKMRGYLFQDRYKSIVTQDQMYIEELVRYIHLNPVRVGICSDIESLANYPWSGHSVIMGRNIYKAQNVKDVLLRFGANPSGARNKYCEFLSEGQKDGNSDLYALIRASNDNRENINSTGSWVIGNRDFIVQAMKHHKEMLRQNLERISVEDVSADICKKMNVKIESIKRKGRNSQSSKARKILAYVANRTYHIPTGEIACYLEVTSSAASNMIRDAERLRKEMDVDLNLLSY